MQQTSILILSWDVLPFQLHSGWQHPHSFVSAPCYRGPSKRREASPLPSVARPGGLECGEICLPHLSETKALRSRPGCLCLASPLTHVSTTPPTPGTSGPSSSTRVVVAASKEWVASTSYSRCPPPREHFHLLTNSKFHLPEGKGPVECFLPLPYLHQCHSPDSFSCSFITPMSKIMKHI